MQHKSKEVRCDEQNAGQIISLVEWLFQPARYPSSWDVKTVLQ